jgi:hypothetical protein
MMNNQVGTLPRTSEVACSLECGLSAQHGYWAVGGDARGHVELFDLQVWCTCAPFFRVEIYSSTYIDN